METLSLTPLDIAVASRTRGGEEVSGDRHFVRSTASGILLAVIDGLGHGAAAGDSAARGVAALEYNPDAPLPVLLARCDAALAATRGVALGLASFHADDARLTWLGVGSIGGLVHHAQPSPGGRREALRSHPGIVGARIRPGLTLWETSLREGDTLVLTTDGVRPEFEDEFGGPPASRLSAQSVLDRYARDADDALVLVARCHGPRGPHHGPDPR